TVTISRFEGASNNGSYRLTITIGGDEVLQALDTLTSLDLSGSVKLIDTDHFRIHYTLTGEDATDEDFAAKVAETMEIVWSVEIDQLGWPAPPTDGILGGDSRLDVYLTDILDDDGGGALGIATSGDVYGDNPNTPEHERYASYSHIRIDN